MLVSFSTKHAIWSISSDTTTPSSSLLTLSLDSGTVSSVCIFKEFQGRSNSFRHRSSLGGELADLTFPLEDAGDTNSKPVGFISRLSCDSAIGDDEADLYLPKFFGITVPSLPFNFPLFRFQVNEGRRVEAFSVARILIDPSLVAHL